MLAIHYFRYKVFFMMLIGESRQNKSSYKPFKPALFFTDTFYNKTNKFYLFIITEIKNKFYNKIYVERVRG